MTEKKGCPGPFWAPFWGSFLIKKRVKKRSEQNTSLGRHFGHIFSDLGLHFEADFDTFAVLDGQKWRSGENVKMSTASRRNAHLRVLTKYKIRQIIAKNWFLDTSLWRHICGSPFGDIWAHFGVQKWPIFVKKRRRKTIRNLRRKKDENGRPQLSKVSPSDRGVWGQ